MILLDDSSPTAVVVDTTIPPSATALQVALVTAWPRLEGRVMFNRDGVDAFDFDSGDVIVSCHACGALTDRVLASAVAVRARVAALPCCHDTGTCDAGPLAGWMDVALAVDTMRAVRLEAQGYHVRTQTIPADITPKNRLLLGEPR